MTRTPGRLVSCLAALAISLAALHASRAPAQDDPGQPDQPSLGQPSLGQPSLGQPCQILRIALASFLSRCGDRLHSFALAIDEIRYAARGDGKGNFIFGCPIEPMCQGEPATLGWFMNPEPWRSSPRGEPEISLILRSRSQEPSFPVCDAFDVMIADMPGRAVCYVFPDTGMAAIGIAAADAEVGVVLVFEERTTDWAALRDKVAAKLPLFVVRRASGDAGLIRWMAK